MVALTASQVSFQDDTATSLRGSNRELDAKDVFFLSRLNDPSTYFFHWLCKRYNLKLEESLRTCPICLENVNHSIQLSCGHTFCRQCLKQAAEREMTSCALCRKSHVLDPDALRAQFNAKRLANMAWRLGDAKAERSFSKPSWESAPGSPARGAGKQVAQGGGSSSSSGGKSVEVEGSSCSSSSSKGEAMLGALPHSTRPRHSNSVSRWFEPDADCGASPVSSLTARWTGLLQRGSCGAVAVGDTAVAELAGAWRRSLSGRGGVAAVPAVAQVQQAADVGAASVGELSGRWGRLRAACESDECGGLSAQDLASRWAAISQHLSPEQEADAGSEQQQQLGGVRWSRLMTGGVACLEEGVGGLEGSVLQERGRRRRRMLEQQGGGDDVGALSAGELRERSAVAVDRAAGGGRTVGGLTAEQLKGRWGQPAVAGEEGADAGALTVAGLSHRWRQAWSLAGGQDVGARPAEEMRGVWATLLMRGQAAATAR